MKQVLNAFNFAISYFSILPVFTKKIEINNEIYKYILVLLPLVGAILATFTIFLNIGLNNFFTSLYSSFICGVFYLFLYGFLHLEAVCDVVDAWFASHGGKDAYSIMKESTIGAIGAIYTFCFILLKVGAITYLLYEKEYILFLLICTFSRLNFIYLLGLFKFNKDSFLSLAFQSSGILKVRIFALIYVVIALLLSSYALILLIISMLSFYIILKKLNDRFSFVNGDCLGYTLEHTELILLNLGLIIIL